MEMSNQWSQSANIKWRTTVQGVIANLAAASWRNLVALRLKHVGHHLPDAFNEKEMAIHVRIWSTIWRKKTKKKKRLKLIFIWYFKLIKYIYNSNNIYLFVVFSYFDLNIILISFFFSLFLWKTKHNSKSLYFLHTLF